MAPALGLGVLWGLLGLLWDPGGATKVLHSLRYLAVAVSEPSPGVPQFLATGYLDGIPFTRYDSERGRAEPLTQWMKDGVKPEDWERGTQIAVGTQQVFARGLETLRERYNQSRGLHTWLRVSSCELLSDGGVRGYYRVGYDGRDFISFDLGSERFVPADSAAEITRRRWEKEEVAEGFTNYLKHECPEWLRKYVGYREKELERKEPPDVHVSGKEEHGMLILSCHAYGFYPNTITVSWMKGDDTLDQETERGGIVPNSDGTFHTWARIEALPEEREQYRCRVEHPGMPEPGIFALEQTSGGNLTVVVAVSVIAAILILILIGFGVWKLQSGRRDRSGYNPAAGRDVGTNSSSTVLLRQEPQILTMLHFWCEIILLGAINPGSLHQCLEVLLWEPGMGMGSLGQRWRHQEQDGDLLATPSSIPCDSFPAPCHMSKVPPGQFGCLGFLEGQWDDSGMVGGSGQALLSPVVLECPKIRAWDLREVLSWFERT